MTDPTSHKVYNVGRAAVPTRQDVAPDPRDIARASTPVERKRRSRWTKIAAVTGPAIVLVLVLAAGGGFLYYRSIDAGIKRTDAFGTGNRHPQAVPVTRPPVAVVGAQNFLLLGSDSRDPDDPARRGQPGEGRSDATMLLHVDAAHQKAYLISLPRDLYVHIPPSPTNPGLGNKDAKINAAFAWGGVPLTVQTVEGYTGVHIDHVVLVDFAGFQQVTDALGGVDLYIEQDITGVGKGGRHFTKGLQHLNGSEALEYVRQRQQFLEGDFARMRHQREFLKALLDKAASTDTLSNPLKLNAFLKSVAKTMTVDNDFSLADVAFEFRNIRSSDLTMLTSPNLGSKMINKESVVISDPDRAKSLYSAVIHDTVADWIAQNPSATTGTGG